MSDNHEAANSPSSEYNKYLNELIDYERVVLTAFYMNFHKAWKDGWRIREHEGQSYFTPPDGHQAKKWTAQWYKSTHKSADGQGQVFVPNWFIEFYPVK